MTNMSPGRGTPKFGIRLPADLWREFGEVASAAGMDRSELLRAWIAWYVRRPGAKMPTRPPGAD